MFKTISKTPTEVSPVKPRIVNKKRGTKILYDSNGKVISSTNLTEADIPSLNISKIIDLQATLDTLSAEDNIPTGVTNNILYYDGSA